MIYYSSTKNIEIKDRNLAKMNTTPLEDQNQTRDKKRGWLALLSTDLDLPGEEIVRLYGKRWDIEVFFKMCKQHLQLVKEIQIRNYDGLIGHTSLVIARYNVLSLFQREHVDQRSFGDLFRACHDELTNISFLTALQRIMIMVKAFLQKAHTR